MTSKNLTTMQPTSVALDAIKARIRFTDIGILLLLALAKLLIHVLVNNQYGWHRDELDMLDSARYLDVTVLVGSDWRPPPLPFPPPVLPDPVSMGVVRTLRTRRPWYKQKHETRERFAKSASHDSAPSVRTLLSRDGDGATHRATPAAHPACLAAPRGA